MKRLFALFLTLSLLGGLTACGIQSSSGNEASSGNASSPAVEAPEESRMAEPAPSLAAPAQPEEPVYPDPAEELPSTQDYIHQVVREHVDQIEQPGMTEFEKVKAATDYLGALGYYCQSPALDVWRWRTSGDTIPTYEEMRALNMLLFGAETCEGYTSTLNLLLEEMGIETRYMTGMTYSQGELAYHSWSQVKVDGIWYHLDANIGNGLRKRPLPIFLCVGCFHSLFIPTVQHLIFQYRRHRLGVLDYPREHLFQHLREGQTDYIQKFPLVQVLAAGDQIVRVINPDDF